MSKPYVFSTSPNTTANTPEINRGAIVVCHVGESGVQWRKVEQGGQWVG
jgi:hypothetical protein